MCLSEVGQNDLNKGKIIDTKQHKVELRNKRAKHDYFYTGNISYCNILK